MSIEAMKQALEALELVKNMLDNDYYIMPNETVHTKVAEVSIALRAAIAEASGQDVQQEMDCYGDGNVYRGQRSGDSQYQTIYEGSFPEKIWEVVPPCREWVGLMDEDPSVEQLDQIIDLLARTHVRISARELLRVWIVAYTRAIEAKLKEKNT